MLLVADSDREEGNEYGISVVTEDEPVPSLYLEPNPGERCLERSIVFPLSHRSSLISCVDLLTE